MSFNALRSNTKTKASPCEKKLLFEQSISFTPSHLQSSCAKTAMLQKCGFRWTLVVLVRFT